MKTRKSNSIKLKEKSYGQIARAAWLKAVSRTGPESYWNVVARAVIAAYKDRQKAKADAEKRADNDRNERLYRLLMAQTERKAPPARRNTKAGAQGRDGK